jgi:hypothetical protein
VVLVVAVPKPWVAVVLVVADKAARGAEAQDVKVQTFVRHSPNAARRTRPSDPKKVHVAAGRKLAVPEMEAVVTPNLRKNHQSVLRVSAQRISRRLAPASLAHRGEGLALGPEGLEAPVDLDRKAEGLVARAGLVRLMVAAVPNVAGLPAVHRATRNPKQRIDL